jgi:hypothetical protein
MRRIADPNVFQLLHVVRIRYNRGIKKWAYHRFQKLAIDETSYL